MKEYLKPFFKQVTLSLDEAGKKLNEQDYMDLCAEVESEANARYEAMKEQIRNADEEALENED